MTTLENIKDFLVSLDTQDDPSILEMITSLGFDIGDLDIKILPISTMLQAYLDGTIRENQLTPAGFAYYSKLLQKDDKEIKVDCFDFKTYFDDFLLMTKYYYGLELYLRTALWIRYKYEFLQTMDDRDKLDLELANKSGKKEYLDDLLSVFDPDSLVERWYLHFNPNKLTPDFIPYIMSKPQYINGIGLLFNYLYKKYVDKEWKLQTPLWFSEEEFEHLTPIISPQQKGPAGKIVTLHRQVLSPDYKQPRKPNPPKVVPIEVGGEYTKDSLNGMTCPQLKDILKRIGLYNGCSKMRKSELIDKILQN